MSMLRFTHHFRVQDGGGRRRPRRAMIRSEVLALIALALLACAFVVSAGAADDHDEAIEATRTSIEKLVETRRII